MRLTLSNIKREWRETMEIDALACKGDRFTAGRNNSLTPVCRQHLQLEEGRLLFLYYASLCYDPYITVYKRKKFPFFKIDSKSCHYVKENFTAPRSFRCFRRRSTVVFSS